MSTNTKNINLDFISSWRNNEKYFEMLRLMAGLSKLFSENSIPFLHYRLAENLFCKYYNALNDARSCTAYDARIGTLGIGIKTFGIKEGGFSVEKIAEFDKLKPTLDVLSGLELAKQLAQYRNDRIDFANNTYGVKTSIYHIVGRQKGKLIIFNSPYQKIDLNSILKRSIKDNKSTISFDTDTDYYSFNKSKSVLMKRFNVPDEYKTINVDIIEDPLELLYQLISFDKQTHTLFKPLIKGIDYVILPLYSTRGKKQYVPVASGLNQWHAGGRKRDPDEVYIPIPISIHKKYPAFFPSRNIHFELQLPNGKTLVAKVCQDNGKALMSNPNIDLGKWILRQILRKKPGELVTINDLERYGIDSVRVENLHAINSKGECQYRISFSNAKMYEDYATFIDED